MFYHYDDCDYDCIDYDCPDCQDYDCPDCVFYDCPDYDDCRYYDDPWIPDGGPAPWDLCEADPDMGCGYDH